jgi:hypothetical protein
MAIDAVPDLPGHWMDGRELHAVAIALPLILVPLVRTVCPFRKGWLAPQQDQGRYQRLAHWKPSPCDEAETSPQLLAF